MSEVDADQKAEKPERPPTVGDGIAESREAARQTDAARDEYAEDRIPVTLLRNRSDRPVQTEPP